MKKCLMDLTSIVEDWHDAMSEEEKEYYGDCGYTNWLKLLKERYTWKPSEGQLECLDYAIEKAEKDWSPLTNNRVYLTLKALKEQLLELRGSKI